MARNCTCNAYSVSKCPTHEEAACREPRAPRRIGIGELAHLRNASLGYRRFRFCVGAVQLGDEAIFDPILSCWPVSDADPSHCISRAPQYPSTLSFDADRENFKRACEALLARHARIAQEESE